ncbi:murein biosynthesis integral membrane protein MurJ [Lentibacillus saliphilus]|uniref:murein biosynthesis integral membrane protein MurJ n=1 Tax=Lentibacillus saliphilus TaxID=2737028 RepID=UPI001C2FCD83|nr:murein biosynthesis integral membrane protein MurJ [Lentibacillus saliphilus]
MKTKLGLASILFIGTALLLKLSGLLRDIVIAYYFGDSYVAEAYLAAFIIPNMFILLLTTGMKDAFIPSYIKAFEQHRGQAHFGQVFKGILIASLAISLIGFALAPVYVPVFYPEFSVEASQIAVTTAMIFFGAIVFVGMNSVLEAFLDAENKFSLSQVSQIIVLMTSIAGAVLFADDLGIYSLAVGYFVGAIISLLFKLFLIIPRNVLSLKGKINWSEIKQFYLIFIPVGLTVAVGQINLMIGMMFASHYEEGAITYINYAKNLVHMPQGIFGVTIGMIIFPLLSKAIATNNMSLFRKGIERGFTLMYFILLPAIFGMLILMPNLVELLYERGAFTSNATKSTTQVAYLYFGSVLFYSLNNITNKGFYSLKKGHIILIISGISIVINIIFNFLFTKLFGYEGIPLAASINGLFCAGVSFIVFRKLMKDLNMKALVTEFLKITCASLIMVGALYIVLPLFDGIANITQIIIVAVLGAALYLVSAYLLKANSLSILFDIFVNRERKKN